MICSLFAVATFTVISIGSVNISSISELSYS